MSRKRNPKKVEFGMPDALILLALARVEQVNQREVMMDALGSREGARIEIHNFNRISAIVHKLELYVEFMNERLQRESS